MMFTGIISDRGRVTHVATRNTALSLTIEAPLTAGSLAIGDSVAIDGVCLTAVSLTSSAFTVTLVGETLSRSTFPDIETDDMVNLERPLSASGRLDGHIVQGHVDGVGTLTLLTSEGESQRMRFSIPSELSRYVVVKGSIAVDGVSLTITAVSKLAEADAWFEIVVIPHTLEMTGLGTLQVASKVNIEVDPIAKYVERLVGVQT